MSKISLKLDEANDLNFQFKIQGTTSEPGASAPQFRFLVSEKGNPNSMGFVFHANAKESNGTVTVTVPPLKEMVRENTAYTGKVEVVIGTRILTPTIMEVEFTRSLSVEVVPVTKNKLDEQLMPEELLESLEAASESVAPTPTPQPKKQITLTKSQLQKLIEQRTALKRQKVAQPSSDPLKNSLKEMMKSALEDD